MRDNNNYSYSTKLKSFHAENLQKAIAGLNAHQEETRKW